MTPIKNYLDAFSMAAEARNIYEDFERTLIEYLESTNYDGTDFAKAIQENSKLSLSRVKSRQSCIPKNRHSFWVRNTSVDSKGNVKYHPRPNRDRTYYIQKKDETGHYSLTLRLEGKLSLARILDASFIRRQVN
jgi:hypothetical protein